MNLSNCNYQHFYDKQGCCRRDFAGPLWKVAALVVLGLTGQERTWPESKLLLVSRSVRQGFVYHRNRILQSRCTSSTNDNLC